MRVCRVSVLCALCCAGLISAMRAGEIVDRIVANVNGHILLQSDWDEEVAFEALVNGRLRDSFTPTERKAALDRLIDQELLREQVRPSENAAAAVVSSRVAEIRKLYPDAATDSAWHAILQRCGLTEAVLEKRLAADIQLMRLVEAHLRPSVQVDSHAVESYYRERLLPELQKSGQKQSPLNDVYANIKNLLTEQKINQLLDTWLVSLRAESKIQFADAAGAQAR